MKLELSVIVPTFNESGNVIPLYLEIKKHLGHSAFEVVFVDDNSSDGTIAQINELVEQHPNVRLIRRLDKRGLSSACIEGFASSNSKYLAVIDADLQHDPATLKLMLDKLKQDRLDIAVASRFTDGAHVEGLSHTREKISKFGNILSRIVTGANLSDPLSGYFMISKQVMDLVIDKLSGKGFKILLDIFSTCRLNRIKLNFCELPITFRKRQYGESKLDSLVVLEFLVLILDKIFGRFVPIRFILFIMVGLSGLVLHLLILAMMLRFFQIDFTIAQSLTTLVVMTSNFFINNAFTYRDRRLKGRQMLTGLLSFCLACSAGAFINITMATFLFDRGIFWLIAGFVGCLVGSVWNYGITSYITWRNIS